MVLHLAVMLLVAVPGLAWSTGDRAPAAAVPAEASEPPPAARGTHLELRTAPLVELYYRVRALAADPDADLPPGYESAVDAARAVQRTLGSFGGWGPLDSQVFLADEPQDLVRGFGELPEPYHRRGREISIRDDALRLARAIREQMPGFLQTAWSARRAELERRIADLETRFMPRHREALAFMMESLGIPDPQVTVQVVLVNATNPPGAMTYYLRGGAPACVIDITVGGTADLLHETILHESCHTLDMASREAGSAFATLRSLLEQRGLTRADEDWHTIPHTLMFVQAEETMRRLFNPDHVAYGDATDLYERTGVTAVVERRVWSRYLDGELSRDAALGEIVETLDPRPAAE